MVIIVGIKTLNLGICGCVNDIADFKLMMLGRNSRYPNLPNNLKNFSVITPHYDWLVDKANRTMHIDGTATYKQGLWAEISPRLNDIGSGEEIITGNTHPA